MRDPEALRQAAGNEPPGVGAPPGAVEMLRKNPTMAAQFDEKYGAGASRQYLGGAGASPHTFPE